MASFFNISNYLIESADSLAAEVVEGVLHRMKLEIPQWEKQQALAMYIQFMEFLGRSLIDDKKTVSEELVLWSKENGERQAASGAKISEIIVRYPPTRDIFIEILTKISVEFELSIKETAFVIKRINAMLDVSLNETVFAFERLTDKIMDEKQREMAELSAPVVPIKEGMAVLPLIGTIDSYRATYILEKVVPQIAELQIKRIIIDFSGILTIDIEIARYLYQIENILRLLGITTIMTGLRPELAQTIVNAGIDMSSIKTFATVKQALDSLK